MSAASLALAAIGVGLLLVATYDALRTTVAPTAGGGPLTRQVASALWRAAHRFSRGPESHLLGSAGTAILLATIATWVVLLWAGWALVFSADPSAIVRSASREPASTWDIVYFAGYTLFTLGVGDLVPATPPYQLLTPVATLHGLFTVTLAITYLLPVMSATAERRQQAAAIWGMGGSAVEIVRSAWYKGSLSSLERDLQALSPALLTTVERHPTYPVLHYFHSADPRTGFAPRVAALDDAVTLLLYVVHPDVRLHPGTLLSIRRAVDELLDTSPSRMADDDVGVPPTPDMEPLADAGIPLAEAHDMGRVWESQARRRQRLRGFVIDSGWAWQVVETGPHGD